MTRISCIFPTYNSSIPIYNNIDFFQEFRLFKLINSGNYSHYGPPFDDVYSYFVLQISLEINMLPPMINQPSSTWLITDKKAYAKLI